MSIVCNLFERERERERKKKERERRETDRDKRESRTFTVRPKTGVRNFYMAV